MPTPKNLRNAPMEGTLRGRLAEKSSSFHAQNFPSTTMSATQIRRPKTVPDLVSDWKRAGKMPEVLPRQPPKLLLKVTMLRSLGPVQVVMKPESTVDDLLAAAMRQYQKEGRRPILPTNNPSDYDLHYSQFSLESLDREEKLTELGSRNFFLCPRSSDTADGGAGGDGSEETPLTSCSKEAKGCVFARLRFMDFLL